MNAETTLTIERTIHFDRVGKGRKEILTGEAPAPPAERGRVPKVSRLMALALRLEGLLRDGTVADYAHLARLGQVTRARVSQIMNLLNLAPDLQEEILFFPQTVKGRDVVILA